MEHQLRKHVEFDSMPARSREPASRYSNMVSYEMKHKILNIFYEWQTQVMDTTKCAPTTNLINKVCLQPTIIH